MLPYRVLVIGGYGFFGRRLVERLSRHTGLHIIVAGRSATRGKVLVESLSPCALSEVTSAALDASLPDLVLLPKRYPGNPVVSFGAGLELTLLHRGMTIMARLTRLGIVSNWSHHAALLKRAADCFKYLGSDAGAMHVTVTGKTALDGTRTRTWHLVATAGDGPYVPTLAAAALVRQLQQDPTPLVGARPCVGLLTLANFAQEARGLHIVMAEVSA